MRETLQTEPAHVFVRKVSASGQLAHELLEKLAILEQIDHPGANTAQIAQFISPFGRWRHKVPEEDIEQVIHQRAVRSRTYFQGEDGGWGAEAPPVLSNTPPLNHEWKQTWKNLWLKDRMPGYPLSDKVDNTNPGQPILLANGRVAEKIGVIHRVFGPVISEGHIRFPDPPKPIEDAEEDFFEAQGMIGVWAKSQHPVDLLTSKELEAGNTRLQRIINAGIRQ